MADDGVVAGSGRLTDWVSLGVLASWVPRDAVDDAIEATGKAARRSDRKLPPHVMAYFVMALALFADDDYEEVAVRLTETLASWGAWDQAWEVPTSGGITQARQRLGYEPLKELFGQVAGPVAEEDTPGAFLGRWRLMSIDGFEWDAPATKENIAAFGLSGAAKGEDGRATFPRARVVTLSECASHAVAGAAIGGVAGKGTGEQVLARELYPRLEADWLLIADRAFYNWPGWCAAADTGAALLWRVSSIVRLPVLELLPDGSYRSVLIPAKITGRARQQLTDAARAGQDLDPARARAIRVIEYEVTDRDGQDELIALITTITDPRQASAAVLAAAYQQRWEHEAGNAQLKTYLRGPGRILRSKSPDMVRQEIYGYLLTHYAISALTCKAATAAGIDPDRVKFRRTTRIVRRRVTDLAFSP
jgi:hypothetical protein